MAVSVASRQKHASSTSNATSYTPTISFAAALAHDICIVFVSADGNPTLTTASAGWAKIGAQASYSTTCTGAVFCCADVSGTGQGGLQVDSDANEQYSCQIYLIRGGDKNNITVATASTGSSTNPDPPNCAPALGLSEPYCWLASHHSDSTVVSTVAPTNFVQLQTQAGGGTNGASTSSAEYLATAASMNPGTFTAVTEQWVSFTVAIPPPGVAGVGAANGTSAGSATGDYAPTIGSGAGHADGASTCTAGGAYLATVTGAGHADGSSSVSGQAGFTGRADGTSTATAVGVTARVAIGEAFGYSSVSGVGLKLSSSGVGAAFGIGLNTTDHVLTDENGLPLSDSNGLFLTDNTSSIGAVGEAITGTIESGAGAANGTSAANAIGRKSNSQLFLVDVTVNAGDTVTLSSQRKIGDLEVFWAYNTNGTTAPTKPTGVISLGTNTTYVGARSGMRVCVDTSDTSGTWTNATFVVCEIYRIAKGIGPAAFVNGSSGVVSYTGVGTFSQTAGNSFFTSVAAHLLATDLTTAPTGQMNIASAGSAPMVAAFDTEGGVSSYTTKTVNVNQSGGWVSGSAEIQADNSTWNQFARQAAVTATGNQLTSKVTSPSSNGIQLGQLARAFGRYVVRFTASDKATSGYSVGLSDAQTYTTTTALGANTTTLNWDYGGVVKINNSTIGTAASYTNGDTLYIAVDFVNNRVWCKVGSGNWNNDASANPDTNTGGFDISTLSRTYGVVPARGFNSTGGSEATGTVLDGSASGHGLSLFLPWDTSIAASVGAANGTSTGAAVGEAVVAASTVSGGGASDAISTGAATGAYAPATNSGAGHADGSSTGTATGAYAPSINSGAGAANGTSTGVATGAYAPSINSKAGAADGSSTATATGDYAPTIGSGAGHADGSSTAAARTPSLTVGNADGTSTGTATGAYAPSINSGAGHADGISTGTATGAYAPSINSKAGAADATSTATATGDYAPSINIGAGAANATSTATAEGQQAGTIGSGAGAANATSSANAQAGFTGNANGTSTVTATGAYAPSVASGVAHADATSTGSGIGEKLLSGAGAANATSSANAVTPTLTVGHADGTSTATATGEYVASIGSGAGHADGTSTCVASGDYASGAGLGSGHANATSTGTATGDYAPAINTGAGHADGISSANAPSSKVLSGVAHADATSTVDARTPTLIVGAANATSSANAAGAYAPSINSGAGNADGSSTGVATGSYAPHTNTGVAHADGSSTGTATGAYAPAVNSGAGHANVTSNANAVGEYVGTYAEGAGAANVISNANAAASIVLSGAGEAAAISTSEATGFYAPTVFIAHGNAGSTSSAESYSEATKGSVANSNSFSGASAYATAIFSGIGRAEAISNVNGVYIDFRPAHLGHDISGKSDVILLRGKSTKNRLIGKSSKTEV